MEHGNEQARRHARFFGREYSGPIAQDSIVDLEAIDGASRRYQTILAFDPDTRGAGVCVIHDFALPTPDAHASRSAVEVFALKRRDGRDPLIDLVFRLTWCFTWTLPCPPAPYASHAVAWDSIRRSTCSLKTHTRKARTSRDGTWASCTAPSLDGSQRNDHITLTRPPAARATAA
mmetsp:Transcript_1699/g.5399  ORF Transcript_1699/g.5399 Transcript_1699/m.5399 type:complete len:175 (-) Transcript_1699:544-1068(-)